MSTVAAVVAKLFGIDADDVSDSMRLVSFEDLEAYINTGVVTPEMRSRLAPAPTPKALYHQCRSLFRERMRDVEQGMLVGCR